MKKKSGKNFPGLQFPMHKRKILFDKKKSWEVGILLGGIENDFLAFLKKKLGKEVFNDVRYKLHKSLKVAKSQKIFKFCSIFLKTNKITAR